MRRVATALLFLGAFTAVLCAAERKSTKPLEIYVADVEGGKADLWVTPSGQTLLIDTGSPGGRDSARILQMMQEAGVKQIDNVLLTHYHSDHVGGLQELVTHIPPVKHFYDHGATIEDGLNGHQPEMVPGFQAAYAKIYAKAQHTILKPGDRIPIAGLDWRIVTAGGKITKTPLAGAGKPNASCEGQQRTGDNHDPENGQSVGSVISFGRFRAVDLGDLTTDKEYDLMCPNNPIGKVDLYFVSNHGLDNASTPEFVHGIQPRVAIDQNSLHKGATLQTLKTLYSSPGLESIWELHWGAAAGIEYNSAGLFIANVEEPATLAKILTEPPTRPGQHGFHRSPPHTPAYLIKVSVRPGGTFTISNSRNGYSKTYKHIDR
jgi:beta-lactamase superfamily II metal-dependent hydrolase